MATSPKVVATPPKPVRGPARSSRVRKGGRVTYRISKRHGAVMMSVALFFDMLPLILFPVLLMFPTLTGAMVGVAAGNKCGDQTITGSVVSGVGAVGTVIGNAVGYVVTGGELGFSSIFNVENRCENVKQGAAAAGAVVGGMVNFAIGPIFTILATVVTAVVSFLLVIISFLTFTWWFAMKGVYVFSLERDRMTTNLLALIIEMIPVVGTLIPGIAFSTWRHIRISRKQDVTRAKKRARREARQTAKLQRVAAQQQLAMMSGGPDMV